MRNLSVIIFSQEGSDNIIKGPFPFAAFKKFAQLFKRNKIDDFIREYPLYEDLTMNLIELPYSLEGLTQKEMRKAERIISLMCEKKGLECCVISEKMRAIKDICEPGRPKLITYKGDILFRALIERILRSLAGGKIENLCNCEVAIIEGNSKEELFAFISCLMPLVKYLNIFTRSRAKIEDEVNRIYEESGLSIGIISDSLYPLKDADIIINLADLSSMPYRPRVKKGAIIINYGKLNNVVMPNESIVINGIDVTIPVSLALKLPRKVCGSFSRLEIAEMIICSRLGLEKEMISGSAGYNIFYDLMASISKEFDEQGYSISHFIGLHGKITKSTKRYYY